MGITLTQSFLETVHRYKLIKQGDTVLIAVSGGIDSMALLNLMTGSQDELGIHLAIVHVNHGLRKEAFDDELFVSKQARKYGLRFYSKRIKIHALANAQNQSIEEAARHARYQYFNELCHTIGFDKIATGHHAEDQTETILMNLIRGTGIRGLCGMQCKKEQLIRPLLFSSKELVCAYLQTNKLDYVQDRTNQNIHFLRNKIRHDYVHRLKDDFGHNVIHRINRAGDALLEIEVFLKNEIENALTHCIQTITDDEIVLDIHQFSHYFTAIQKGMLFQLIYAFQGYQRRIQSTDIQQILDLAFFSKSGSEFSLSKDVTVYKTTHKLAFVRTKPIKPRIQIKIDGTTFCSDWGFKINTTRIDDNGEQKFSSSRFTETVDFDEIKGDLFLRPVMNGDAFIPLGMQGVKKIHDFLIDSRVPVYQRENVPILMDQTNIIWIVGHRIDHRYRIKKNTKHILQIKIIE